MNGFWKFMDDNWFLIMIFGGGTIGSAGTWVGKHFDRRQKNKHALQRMKLQKQIDGSTPKPVKAICGCGHDLAFHDRETDACHHEQIPEGLIYPRRCSCQRYTGPELLPTVIAPDIAGLEA